MDGIVAARALHVVVVVLWIGGVSLVTTVVLPAVRRGELGADGFAAFQSIERRFVRQARAAIIIVGASGFYMVARDNLWYRFREAEFWWMHAMVTVWLLFSIGLFVVAPFILHRYLHKLASTQPDRFFARLQWTHWALLVLSLGTIFGAVAGSRGWSVS
jgi:uncharacterized membrane protein